MNHDYELPDSVGDEGGNFIDIYELKSIMKSMKVFNELRKVSPGTTAASEVYDSNGDLIGTVRLWVDADGDSMLGFIPVNGGWRK